MALNETNIRTFEAEAAIGLGLLVKLGSAIGAQGVGLADLAGSGEEPVGTAVKAVALGELVAVRLLGGGGLGTHTVIAAAAIAFGADLYAAANGQVTSTPAGSIIGYAAEAAGAQGERIELIPRGVS